MSGFQQKVIKHEISLLNLVAKLGNELLRVFRR